MQRCTKVFNLSTTWSVPELAVNWTAFMPRSDVRSLCLLVVRGGGTPRPALPDNSAEWPRAGVPGIDEEGVKSPTESGPPRLFVLRVSISTSSNTSSLRGEGPTVYERQRKRD